MSKAARNSFVDNAVSSLTRSKFVAQLETAGNQAFIFDTNRLRENIGASYLLGLSCGEWVHTAADAHGASVVFSTSGRAFLAAETREALESVISDVTWQALVQAPGLTITGSITSWPPEMHYGDASTSLGDAMRFLSEENERIAGQYPAVSARFHRLPPVAQCAVSTLPAEFERRIAGTNEFAAAPSHAKYVAGEKAWKARAEGILAEMQKFLINQFSKIEIDRRKLSFAQSVDSLEEFFLKSDDPSHSINDVGWLAVVHIDGSGVGKAFIEMAKHAWEKARGVLGESKDTSGKALELHLEAYFTLSNGLDTAASAAMVAALAEVVQVNGKIPVVPLIAGGDDVTIICLGRDALTLTATYLRTFEDHTADVSRELCELLGNTAAPKRFTAAAGVAIVKPHYPFHLAHQLAESLINSAKAAVKRTVADGEVIPSSYDVHTLSDSSAIGLDEIRERRQSRSGVRLWGGPYVVSDASANPSLRNHAWLESALRSLREATEDGDGSRSSRSGLNKVKTALFDSPDAALQAERELPEGVLSSVKDVESDSFVSVLGSELIGSSAFVDVLDLLDIHVSSTSEVESSAIHEEAPQ